MRRHRRRRRSPLPGRSPRARPRAAGTSRSERPGAIGSTSAPGARSAARFCSEGADVLRSARSSTATTAGSVTVGNAPPSGPLDAPPVSARRRTRRARERLAPVGPPGRPRPRVANSCRCPCRPRRCSPVRHPRRCARRRSPASAPVSALPATGASPASGVNRGTQERSKSTLVTGQIAGPTQGRRERSAGRTISALWLRGRRARHDHEGV